MTDCDCEYCQELLLELFQDPLHTGYCQYVPQDPSRLCTTNSKIKPHTPMIKLQSVFSKGKNVHTLGWCGAFAILHGVLKFTRDDIVVGGPDLVTYFLSLLARPDVLGRDSKKWTGGMHFWFDAATILDFFGVRFQKHAVPDDEQKTLNRFVQEMKKSRNTGLYLIRVNGHIMCYNVDSTGYGVPVDQWPKSHDFVFSKTGSLAGRTKIIKRTVDKYFTILGDVTKNTQYIADMREIVEHRRREQRNTRPPPVVSTGPSRPAVAAGKKKRLPVGKIAKTGGSLTDRLIPHIPGPVVYTFSSSTPGRADRVYRKVVEDRGLGFESVRMRLIYGKTVDMKPDVLLVDEDLQPYRTWHGPIDIPAPRKHIQHAYWVCPSDHVKQDMFTPEEWATWEAFSKEKMIVGARFIDDSIGFLVWPEPDEEQDGEPQYMFLGGEWHESPFAAGPPPPAKFTTAEIDDVVTKVLQDTGLLPRDGPARQPSPLPLTAPNVGPAPQPSPVPFTTLNVRPVSPPAPAPPAKFTTAEIDDVATRVLQEKGLLPRDEPARQPRRACPTYAQYLFLQGRRDPAQLCSSIAPERYRVLQWTHFDIPNSDHPVVINDLATFLMRPSLQIMEFYNISNPRILLTALHRMQRPALASLLLHVGADRHLSTGEIRNISAVMQHCRSFAVRVPVQEPAGDVKRAWQHALAALPENETTAQLSITAPIQRSVMALTPRELDPARNLSVLSAIDLVRCGLDDRCCAKLTLLLHGFKFLHRVDARGNRFSDDSLEDWEGLVASSPGRYQAIDLRDNAYTVASRAHPAVLDTGVHDAADDAEEHVLGHSADGTLTAVFHGGPAAWFVQVTGRGSVHIPLARDGPMPVGAWFDDGPGVALELLFEDGSARRWDDRGGAQVEMAYVPFR